MQILLFAGLRESCGGRALDLEIQLPTTVAALRAAAEDQVPALIDQVYRVAVDQEYAHDHTAIAEGAEVAFLPPVSGG